MGLHQALKPVFLCALGLSLTTGSISYGDWPLKEDWNFTPRDYAALIKKGQNLGFSSDSEWFPEELKNNLLVTLRYVLNPKLSPPSTKGVSIKDFYHGHVACEHPNRLSEVPTQIHDEWVKILSQPVLTGFDPVNADNLSEYKRAVVNGERATGAYYRAVLTPEFCLHPLIIYHTYEWNTPPGVGVGDPRRNLVTEMGGAEPSHYHPPDSGNASSWDREFTDIQQFAFLIEKSGTIHVTWGGIWQLSRVEGQPLKYPSSH